jgi:hypothetical protein
MDEKEKAEAESGTSIGEADGELKSETEGTSSGTLKHSETVEGTE